MAYKVRRFATEVEARKEGKVASMANAVPIYVIESPNRFDPEAGRFVTDSDGAVLWWERVVDVYVGGEAYTRGG